MRPIRILAAWLSAACVLTAQAQTAADTVRIVVPYAAGGPADQIARLVQQPLSTALGRTVIVDNRGGAGGVIGAAVAAKSPADGSTLLLTTSSLVITAGTTPNLPYNPRKDFEPVYLLGEVQSMLAVRPTLGVNTLAELVARARKADKLNYGSTGVGGTMHIGAELFARAAGVSVVHIPNRGASLAITDLLSGTVDFIQADVPVLRPYVLDGRIKGLAIYDTRRSPQLPDVPTAAEAGLPALQMNNWYGVLVPTGTPVEVRRKLEAALAAVVRQPDVAARLAEAGFSNPSGEAAFRTRLDGEFKRWIPWLKEAGIHAE